MIRKEGFDWDTLYWFFAYIAAGTLAAVLIGQKIVQKFNFYIQSDLQRWLLWGSGALIGLIAILFLYKKEDFVKRATLLGFMILVLAFRMFNK